MINIKHISTNDAKKIKIILADIDDTISSQGKILSEAYSAIWQLHDAGLKIMPITGRSAGWVDHIARMWPVDAVIGENGAFYAYMDNKKNPPKLVKRYFLQPQEVKEAKKKFNIIKKEVFEKFPNCKVASDQQFREFDLAIDFCEDVQPLKMDEVKEIVSIFKKHGANTKISSIHVNGWFGDYDKLTMTKLYIKEKLGIDIEKNPEIAIFIGDSPNDQPMFKFFSNSIGVANILKFEDIITHLPKYITTLESGRGFAEMVNLILLKRI